MAKLFFTVNPGIEDIAAKEIVSELGGNVEYRLLSGRVFLEIESIPWNISERIRRLRMINRALVHVVTTNLEPSYSYLPVLREELLKKACGLLEYVTPETTFAVNTERIGEHEYTSIDISRVIGDVVVELVYRSYGRRPRVDLRSPDVIVYAYAVENELSIGILLTGPWSMHRRGYRVYDHPAALKATIANAMLYLVGSMDKKVLVDPMCGGGTIPIEAALMHEDGLFIGTDINRRHIAGAEANAVAAGVWERVVFRVWDARRIHGLGYDVDYMVLNPPYGIRYGDPYSIKGLYRRFLESAYQCLVDGGRIALITPEYRLIHRYAGEIGYRIMHERTVKHGGLYPHIVVLEK